MEQIITFTHEQLKDFHRIQNILSNIHRLDLKFDDFEQSTIEMFEGCEIEDLKMFVQDCGYFHNITIIEFYQNIIFEIPTHNIPENREKIVSFLQANHAETDPQVGDFIWVNGELLRIGVINRDTNTFQPAREGRMGFWIFTTGGTDAGGSPEPYTLDLSKYQRTSKTHLGKCKLWSNDNIGFYKDTIWLTTEFKICEIPQ